MFATITQVYPLLVRVEIWIGGNISSIIVHHLLSKEQQIGSNVAKKELAKRISKILKCTNMLTLMETGVVGNDGKWGELLFPVVVIRGGREGGPPAALTFSLQPAELQIQYILSHNSIPSIRLQ